MEELWLLLAVWYSGLDEQLPWPVPSRAEVARLWCGLVLSVGRGKAGGGVALQILLRALRQCLCTAPVLPCCGPPLRPTKSPAVATSRPELSVMLHKQWCTPLPLQLLLRSAAPSLPFFFFCSVFLCAVFPPKGSWAAEELNWWPQPNLTAAGHSRSRWLLSSFSAEQQKSPKELLSLKRSCAAGQRCAAAIRMGLVMLHQHRVQALLHALLTAGSRLPLPGCASHTRGMFPVPGELCQAEQPFLRIRGWTEGCGAVL